MDVLLVEPWFGGSHRQWAEGYARRSRHDVELLTLPDDGWKWRLRGAALTLAPQVRRPPDVLFASSMLDVAAFLGHARAQLAHVPVVLYMHENQLNYPLAEGVPRDTSLALLNWTSMAAADAVVFNSEYHYIAWFDALGGLLRTFPPPRHDEMVEAVRAKSLVLPVGVELDWAVERDEKPDPPLIVWNQRWEHDKSPGGVEAILSRVAAAGQRFRVALCGESPVGEVPPAFDRLARELGPRLVHSGYAEGARYHEILLDSSIVVSAAHHEFFGVAVVEAMAAGAVPVLPSRLSYPELVGGELVDTLYRSIDGAAAAITELLADAGLRSARSVAARSAARRFDWVLVASQYDDLLERIAPDAR